MADSRRPSPEAQKRWLDQLAILDPAMHAEIVSKLQTAQRSAAAPVISEVGLPEGVAALGVHTEALERPPGPEITFETIVLPYRPALMIMGDKITTAHVQIEALARDMVGKLTDHSATLEPFLPLVGRIDVRNFPSGMEYVGTGWLVDEDLLVTNRHVAELIARRGPDAFTFIAGRFGDPVEVSVQFGHEYGGGAGATVSVLNVVYIERDATGPDIALLRVARRTDGLSPKRIELADSDATTGQLVAVVGYPARATSDVIPDQDRMERIYGGIFDIKRIAPGLITNPSRGWNTHDCTTLGGNSGSVVLDMATGHAVALHFAGLYLVENYAVPASTIRAVLNRRPWPELFPKPIATPLQRQAESKGEQQMMVQSPTPYGADRVSVTLNVPITVTVSVGAIGRADTAGTAVAPSDIHAAAEALAAQLRGGGALAVRPSLAMQDGAIGEAPCLAVAVHPDRLEAVQQAVPARFGDFEVQVRPASIEDQLGITDPLVWEAPGFIAYDDGARTGPQFSFDWVQERMRLRLHVGPERGFEELSAFLAGTQSELLSSMYQFYAEHVRDAVDGALHGGMTKFTLVLDPQTRDHGAAPRGQFERSSTFKQWKDRGNFNRVYVPEGRGGFVNNAYHIKVTVRDGTGVWLSSGNWTATSQPLIEVADRNDPRKTGNAGNREWHVSALHAPTLATRFHAHIQQDFAACTALGGTLEAAGPDIMVDVPIQQSDNVVLEAAPSKVFEPLEVDRIVRAKPLLTPDGAGAVYCDAVIELIKSATRQLLFQNQYIKVTRGSSGRFGALVDALASAAKRLPDCRIVVRAGDNALADNVAELARRGVDVPTQFRKLANTHTKGIVVDGKRVLVGSHNWSLSGVTANRDASLIFDDEEIANYYARVFEVDWARATLLSVPSPMQGATRLATGPKPPAGYKRVPLADYLEG